MDSKQQEVSTKQQEVSTKQQEAHTDQSREEETSKQEVLTAQQCEREDPPEDLEIDVRSIKSIDVDVHHEMADRYHYLSEGSLSDRVDRLEMDLVKLKEVGDCISGIFQFL